MKEEIVINTIGTVATLLVAAFFVVYWFKKRKQEAPFTVQDLIGKGTIVFEDGIIKNKNMYKLVIEVGEYNAQNASDNENNALWLNFRILLNSIPIPFILYSQSQYIDVKEFADWYKRQYEENDFLTPDLKESGEDVYNHYLSYNEKNSRDYKNYVILHYNPISHSIDSGVETGIDVIDGIFNKLSTDRNISEEEKDDLAKQILNEYADQVFSFAEQIGIEYQPLNRQGVYDMVYSGLQRELSTEARLKDAVDAQSFTYQIDSLTRQLLVVEDQMLEKEVNLK